MADKKQDLSLASYTMGILSIVIALVGQAGIGGIILGIIGLRLNKDKKNSLYQRNKKLNIAGIIIGSIILLFSIILYIYAVMTNPELLI